MATFNGFVLTNKGRELLAKVIAGEQLTFTKMEVGDEAFTGDIKTLTTLVNKKDEFSINQIENQGNGQVLLKTIINNQNINAGYYIKEIGIFAHGDDSTEILYAYNKATEADFFPAFNGSNAVEFEYHNIIIVDQATNITALIDPSITYVTKEEVEKNYVKNTDEATADNDGITSFKKMADYLYPAGAIYTTVSDTFDPNNIFTGTWEKFGEGKTLIGVDDNDNDFNSVEKTGGSKTTTLTIDQMPVHTHSINGEGNHVHGIHAAGNHYHIVNDHAHYVPGHQHVIPWGENPAVYQPDWGIWHAGGGGRMGNDKYTWDNAWGMTSPTDAWTQGSQPGTNWSGDHGHNMDASGWHAHSANNTGGNKEHSNLQPYITVYFWKRIA